MNASDGAMNPAPNVSANSTVSGTAQSRSGGGGGGSEAAGAGGMSGYVPAQAMLTCLYSLNLAFLSEGQLMRKENVDRIRHIPCIGVCEV